MNHDDRVRALLAIRRGSPYGDTILGSKRSLEIADLIAEGLVADKPIPWPKSRYVLTEAGETWIKENR